MITLTERERARMVEANFTAELCRAARAWIQWDQKTLAVESKVSRATLAKFENGLGVPSPNNLEAIRRAFERRGFSFNVSADALRLEATPGFVPSPKEKGA